MEVTKGEVTKATTSMIAETVVLERHGTRRRLHDEARMGSLKLLLAFVVALAAFSCTLLLAPGEAQAKANLPSGSGQKPVVDSPGEASKPVKDALGGATEPARGKEQSGGGGNNAGGNGGINAGGNGGINAEGVTNNAGGGDKASKAVKPVLETAAPTLKGTKKTLKEVTEPVSEASKPVVEKVAPTVETATQPILQETSSVTEPVLEKAARTVEPVMKTTTPLVEPVLGEVAPALGSTPFEAVPPPIEPSLKATVPVVEPALEADEPAAGPVLQPVAPASELVFGEAGTVFANGDELPSPATAIDTLASLSGAPSSVLGAAAEGTALNPRPVPNTAGDVAEGAASYRPVVVSNPQASTMETGLFLGSHPRLFDSSLDSRYRAAPVPAMTKGASNHTPRPFPFEFPAGAPSAGSSLTAGSSLRGSGSGSILDLLAVLPLLLILSRVGTLSWSTRESFGLNSSLRLATERPG